jgi:hypothetical protein
MINKEGLDATSNLPYKSILPLGKNPATNANVFQDGAQYTLPGVRYQPAGGTSSAASGMAVGIDSSNTGKSIDTQSSTLVKILDRNHKSMQQLEMIGAQSTLQTQLLQNIQALTVATANLGNIGLGDMKLLLDGKVVKSRIEKITTQQNGKTR